MHTQQEQEERDELRARFTSWLDTTLYRAKLRYLEKESKRIQTISLDDLPDNFYSESDFDLSKKKNEFDFEEERLATAFANLPLKRQVILSMLFEDELKPAMVAQILNCSVKYVYRQRFRAIEALRKALEEKIDEYDC